MVKIGQKLHNFKFNVFHNSDIKSMELNDFLGKWLVLFFYPADFTFICPTELESFAELYPSFQNLGAELLSVSRDSAFVHKAWHEADKAISKINYPMAADVNGAITEYFGVFANAEERGFALRATFIISPEGEVYSIEINNNSIGRNSLETLRKLEAAIFITKNKGEVCPINWKPGSKSIKLPNLSVLK